MPSGELRRRLTCSLVRSLSREISHTEVSLCYSDAPFLRRASSRRFRPAVPGCARARLRRRTCDVYMCGRFCPVRPVCCAVRPRRSHARFPGDDTPSRSHDVVGHDARGSRDTRDAHDGDDQRTTSTERQLRAELNWPADSADCRPVGLARAKTHERRRTRTKPIGVGRRATSGHERAIPAVTMAIGTDSPSGLRRAVSSVCASLFLRSREREPSVVSSPLYVCVDASGVATYSRTHARERMWRTGTCL